VGNHPSLIHVKRFLSADPVSGIIRWVEHDQLTDVLTEGAYQDTAPHVEYSRGLQNDEDYWRNGVKQEMAHYAHIPNILLEKWAIEGVDIADNDELLRMVNKPEYAYLRTTTKLHE